MDKPVSKKHSAASDDVEGSLYAKREKVYPREVHGTFAYLRTLGVLTLLGIFYGLAWVQYDGHQALLLDLPGRKFYVFGVVFWPQDFIYVTLLLLIAALSLFFFTALAGRLWCGFACPQTVWTEVFLWMERLVEGDRPKQMKLDKAPWSLRKLRLKTSKHLLWIAFAAWTGFTFVGYFTPIRELGGKVFDLNLGPWESFWILFYGFATYGNAGWMREQVCKYMCPYARFQSAMFDQNTLTIWYDRKRGEPRGSRKRADDYHQIGLGDCIDCRMCVQVCPTGIDIREGLQYECIGCSACIDACDDIMDRMNYPKGLIRYTTENALEGRAQRIFRPRVVIYALILVSLTSALGYAVSQRVPLRLDVIRDRNSLYRQVGDDGIENVYTLKVVNMDTHPHTYRLTAQGIHDLEIRMDAPKIQADAGAVLSLPVRLRAEEDELKRRSTHITFTLTAEDNDKLSVTEDARFLGPFSRR